MKDLFEIEHPKDSLKRTNNGMASIAKSQYKSEIKRITRDAEIEQILQEYGGMPEINQIISLKTNGMSDTGSLFRNLIKNGEMNELYLATWIISPENINSICDAVDCGRLKKVVMVCSTRMDELKKSTANKLKEEFGKRSDKISFKICNSHAKVFSISDFNGNKYTICGSGNWTENPRIEYFLLLNNEEVFNHNAKWMQDLIK